MLAIELLLSVCNLACMVLFTDVYYKILAYNDRIDNYQKFPECAIPYSHGECVCMCCCYATHNFPTKQ